MHHGEKCISTSSSSLAVLFFLLWSVCRPIVISVKDGIHIFPVLSSRNSSLWPLTVGKCFSGPQYPQPVPLFYFFSGRIGSIFSRNIFFPPLGPKVDESAFSSPHDPSSVDGNILFREMNCALKFGRPRGEYVESSTTFKWADNQPLQTGVCVDSETRNLHF